ncbi:MAG: hypothetical protein KKB50_00980 [Planctomycetes bacterium]|nr:hypothetical protein [Planctomycetota bacterium]
MYLGLAVLFAGCDKHSSPNGYEAIAGVVGTSDAEAGELSLRIATEGRVGPEAQTVFCVVNNHTEIYVNDKLSTIEAIGVGDAIEVIGCHDSSAGLKRFLVSFAYIDRAEPLPPPPDLSTPTSRTTLESGEP